MSTKDTPPTFEKREGKLRLAYLVSHPIQYQVSLLRRIAQEPDIDLTVFFGSDHSAKGYTDEEFGGIHVKWDVPLLEGYRYEVLPLLRRSNEITFWSPVNRGIYSALRKGKFDALWLHGYWSLNGMAAMAAAKLLGIPVLLRVDGTLIDHRRSVLRLLIKRAFFYMARHFMDAVLPVGTKNKEYWAHYLGEDFPAFLMPYAVDNGYFQTATMAASHSREQFRQELGLEAGCSVILYASKLMDRKRCIDLIDAYLGMQPNAGDKKPYLLIVGDGTERTACEDRVRAAGASKVRFLGFQNQSQLPRFFDLCDVFVLPSEYEPFALIVNEVMNAGRALVVSDEVGSQVDLVTDGVNGKVFPARNVEALRVAVEIVLENDAARREMGRRSLQRIQTWSFEEDIQGLRQALHSVARLPISTPANSLEAAELSAPVPEGLLQPAMMSKDSL